MDDKDLHTDPMKKDNFPEPDVPVDEAWAGMKQLLLNVPPSAPAAGKALTGKLLYYAAAVALITTVAVVKWMKPSQKQVAETVILSQDKPVKNILPGGELLFLNNNSRVVEEEAENKKQLVLTNGAVYFETGKAGEGVQHIKLGVMDVLPANAALYLSFDSASSVALVHVQNGAATIKTNRESMQLLAGETIQYDSKQKQLAKTAKTNVNLFSYATLVFELNDAPLQEVLPMIEKAYGFSFVLNNKKLNQCRITTRFDNKTLKEIMDVMAYTLNLDYSIDEKNKQVTISGDGCE